MLFLLLDMIIVVGVGGFVMMFVGIFNVLLLLELMSNVGDEDDGEKREVGEISSGKWKKLEVVVVVGRSGEEGIGRVGEMLVLKKLDFFK